MRSSNQTPFVMGFDLYDSCIKLLFMRIKYNCVYDKRWFGANSYPYGKDIKQKFSLFELSLLAESFFVERKNVAM